MSRQTPLGLAAIFGMRWRTARWKSSFSITPRPRASAGFMATGKFSPSTWPVSSRSSSGGSGRGSPGFGGVNVGLARRAERAVDGRVFVEEREEHDDAFDDGGLDLQIEPRPRVVEPPLNRLEAVTTVRANRGRSRCEPRTGMSCPARYASSSASYGCPTCVSPSGTHSVHGACRICPWYSFAADREDVRRVVELRFQGADVLVDQARLR